MLKQLWERDRFSEILDHLKFHPYVMDPPAISLLRAVFQAELKQYELSAYFFRLTFDGYENQPIPMILSSTKPLMLMVEGKLSEAKDCSQVQVRIIPNVVTYITASLIQQKLSYLAIDTTSRQTAVLNQIELCKNALEEFDRSHERVRNFADICEYLALCLSACAVSYKSLNETDAAKNAFEMAMKLNPQNHDLLALQRMVLQMPMSSSDGIIHIQSLVQRYSTGTRDTLRNVFDHASKI